jgi:TP901 family phage tail tape measure protein
VAEGFLPPVVATLVADIKQFTAKMDEAELKMDEMGKKGASTSSVLSSGFMGIGAAVGGLALGVGGLSIDLASKLQTSVTRIAGQLSLTSAQTSSLERSFLDLAMGTEFTSQQLSSAYAGVATQVRNLAGGQNLAIASTQILKSAMDLSVASGTDLSTSTSQIVTLLRAFSAPVSQAKDQFSLLYNTTNLTGLGMDSVSNALIKMKNKLGDAAPSAGDMAGLLADMATHGLNGARALQSFTGGLDKILAPSKQVQSELSQLGVGSVFINGKFEGMKNLIAQLSPAFSKLTQQQQIYSATQLVGAGAAAGFLDVVKAGPAAYAKSVSAVSNITRAQNAATAQSKTFRNELETLKSAATNLGTQLGLALLPKAQQLVDWLSGPGLNGLKQFMAGFDAGKANTFVGQLGVDVKRIGQAIAGLVGVLSKTLIPFIGTINNVFKRSGFRFGLLETWPQLIKDVGNLTSRMSRDLSFIFEHGPFTPMPNPKPAQMGPFLPKHSTKITVKGSIK